MPAQQPSVTSFRAPGPPFNHVTGHTPAPKASLRPQSDDRQPLTPATTARTPRTTNSPSKPAGPFADLLGKDAWQRLPPAVQRRFDGNPSDIPPKTYTGAVITTRLSWPGRILARLSRLIATPLPETDGATGPASVMVAYNEAICGQIWTRVYARPGRFPQVVHSVKRFSGPTGLEEFIGPGSRNGIAMTLSLSEESGSLVFRSERYVIALAGLRIPWPNWLSPGRMTIRHSQIEGPQFRFTLDLKHPWFGPLIHQDCIFTDPIAANPKG